MSADRPDTAAIDAHIAWLRRDVAARGSAVIAFSAGVDSSVVLRIAVDALGDRALAVTGMAPSVAAAEANDAERIAREIGARWAPLPTREMERPEYVANNPDRCFHCKSELYAVCRRVADEQGIGHILNGTNADDVGDWRPGLRAADDARVHSPLLARSLGKRDVRAIARRLGLSNWDKPALACLASRLPYGTAVTAERLAAVERIEHWLRERGFRDVRARHFGREVRLEVEAHRVTDLERIAREPELTAAVRAAGFDDFAVTPDGYRSGRLNDALQPAPGADA